MEVTETFINFADRKSETGTGNADIPYFPVCKLKLAEKIRDGHKRSRHTLFSCLQAEASKVRTKRMANQFMDRQPVFERMGELANYANMTYEQQESYMRSLDTWRTVMAAEEFTFTKGHKKGFEEGRAEEKMENARNLKLLGVPVDTIVQATGLTIEEISKL